MPHLHKSVTEPPGNALRQPMLWAWSCGTVAAYASLHGRTLLGAAPETNCVDAVKDIDGRFIVSDFEVFDDFVFATIQILYDFDGFRFEI